LKFFAEIFFEGLRGLHNVEEFANLRGDTDRAGGCHPIL
jgi:hypothetical protein